MGVYVGPHDSNALIFRSKSNHYSYIEYTKLLKDKYATPNLIATIDSVYDKQLNSHHRHHACTSLYSYNKHFSGLCLVLDGYGQGVSEQLYDCDTKLGIRSIYSNAPGCSIGNLWNVFGCIYFDYPMHANNGKAGSLMALAAYGKPIPDLIDKLNRAYSLETFIFLKNSKSYDIDREMVTDYFGEYSDDLPNVAASLQQFTNQATSKIIKLRVNKGDTILMAGGVAHNVVLIKHLEDTLGINIFTGFVQGDEGISLGEHLHNKYILLDRSYKPKDFRSPYSDVEVEPKLPYSDIVTDLECHGVIALYNGSPEIGNRALGHRSFIAKPNFPDIKEKLDRLKGREPYRPYGVMILEDECSTWLKNDIESPYMNKLAEPNEKFINTFPTLVHKDGTIRVQTITESMYPQMFKLLKHAFIKTGNAVLINTSLNINTPMLYRDDEHLVEKMVDDGVIASGYINGDRYAID